MASSSSQPPFNVARAWELVAAVPLIASAIRALMAGAAADASGSLAAPAEMCIGYSAALLAVHDQLGHTCSAPQLATWAAAAEALLRLLPLLLQLDATLQQLPVGSKNRPAAGHLACQLAMLLWNSPALQEGDTALGATAADAERSALSQQLALAHLACCRVAHWFCGQAAADEAFCGLAPSPELPLLLMGGLCFSLGQLLELERAAAESSQSSR